MKLIKFIVPLLFIVVSYFPFKSGKFIKQFFPCFIPDNGNIVKLNSFSLCINCLTTFLFIDHIWIIYLI